MVKLDYRLDYIIISNYPDYNMSTGALVVICLLCSIHHDQV